MSRYVVAEPASYTDGPGRSRFDEAVEYVEEDADLLYEARAHMVETMEPEVVQEFLTMLLEYSVGPAGLIDRLHSAEEAAIVWRAELLMRGIDP